MTFDPISHAAGIGAGQEMANSKAGVALARERQRSLETSGQAAIAIVAMGERIESLENEIKNKWIPYGVRLRASIMARQVEKADLIDALKAGDPSNAERIAQEADQHRVGEYDRIANDPKAVGEVREVVLKEAEAGRLG